MVFAQAEQDGITLLKAARLLNCDTADIEQMVAKGDLSAIPSYVQRTRDKFRKVSRSSVEKILKAMQTD